MSDNSPLEESRAAESPAAEPSVAEPPAQQQRSIVHGRPFQFAAIGVAGLVIGGFIGLGTGFAAGAFFGGGHGHHHRDHGDERFRDRPDGNMRPHRVPGKQLPGQPLPGKPVPPQPAAPSPAR